MLPIITKECMMFNLKAENKGQVLEQMAERFDEQGYLTQKELFLQDVIEREKVFPTYIDYGIGLPHGKSQGTEQAGLCIARLEQPVVWDEESGEQADMVIMIAVKAQSDNDLHLQILAKLSRALMHDDFRTILKEGTLDKVYDILAEQLGV